MLSSILRQCGRRGFQTWSSRSLLRAPEKGTSSPASTGSSTRKSPEDMSSSSNPLDMTKQLHGVGPWDRKFLVWSGQYKTQEEVPPRLEFNAITKARNWARIRINLYILGFATVGCAISVYLGKEAWRRGETVEGNNLEWHRRINEAHRKEQELLRQKELEANPELVNIPEYYDASNLQQASAR